MVVCLHFHGFPAERFPETEPYLENVTFVIVKWFVLGMFWPFERLDTRSLCYGPNICIDMAFWDRLPGTLDATILSIAVQLDKNLAQEPFRLPSLDAVLAEAPAPPRRL